MPRDELGIHLDGCAPGRQAQHGRGVGGQQIGDARGSQFADGVGVGHRGDNHESRYAGRVRSPLRLGQCQSHGAEGGVL